MLLTERIILKTNKQIPKQHLSYLCHIAKNLYNEANYQIRQNFLKKKTWIRYNELYQKIKSSENYKLLPAQTSQQILRFLDRNWKSFFRTLKVWKKDPEKFSSRPRIPKYKRKDGEFVVIFTNQQCKIKNGWLHFPKKSRLSPIRTRITNHLHQVRIIPRGEKYVIEIIHEKEPIDLKLNGNRIVGIDLGLNNLVTVVNNAGLEPFIIKGGIVKSMNQYYNKQLARLRSIKDKQGYKFETKRIQRLTLKRNNKIMDVFHKISRKIIQYCIENDFGRIIIGYNQGWKQKIKMGRRTNQNFVQVPFLNLVKMIQYKALLVGMNVELVDESHTSKCSFLDGESIEHHEHYAGRRVKRGLFKTRSAKLINADVNGAYNIIKKAVPKAFDKVDGIEAFGVTPVSVRIE